MRQYHVKLHFHESKKGNYFAYDMWQWQDQVEERISLFLQVGLFWVEEIRYTSEMP